MDVKTDPATSKLHQETQRIKSLLADAETALDAAQTAANEPPPQAELIDAGTLERARLSDLAGTTKGEVVRLKSLQATQSKVLTDWQTRTAQAGDDCRRHTAAVEFHREALAECRRLELAAFSSAAEKLVQPAETAYHRAVLAMRRTLVELVAVRAVHGGCDVARVAAVTGQPAIWMIDPHRHISHGVALPSIGVIDPDWLECPAGTAPAVLTASAGDLRAEAAGVAEVIINTLKDRREVA